jgi:hypothetical protein
LLGLFAFEILFTVRNDAAEVIIIIGYPRHRIFILEKFGCKLANFRKSVDNNLRNIVSRPYRVGNLLPDGDPGLVVADD